MFDLEKNIEIQKRFTQIHNYLVIVVLVYYLSLYFVSDQFKLTDLVGMIIIFGICLIDMALSRREYFKSIMPVAIVRVIDLVIAAYYIYFSNSTRLYSILIAVVVYVFVAIELLFIFDVIDVFYRIPYAVCINVPLSLMFVCKIMFKGGEVYYNSLYFFFIIIVTMVMYHTSVILASIIKEFTDKLFAQARVINTADQTNDILRENQRKVKRVNEQLGLQKVELETAYNKINRVNSEMVIQGEILKYISSSLDIENLMELITDSVSGSFGTDLCAILLNIEEKNEKKTLSNIKDTLGNDYYEYFKDCINEKHFEEIMKDKQILIDNNVEEGKYEFIRTGELNSLLILPLIKDDNPFGALVVGHKCEGYFIDNISFFEGIVAQFIIAFNNAQLYSQMQNMAIRDALTGIYNRGYLTKMFNKYISEAKINNTPFAVALIDIDKFKNINDTYGHPFGDVVIQTIATLTDDIVNKNKGYVGRYGGEEFVILFPGKRLEEVHNILIMLHTSIKECKIYHNEKAVPVNVSIGVTVYPDTCEDCDELLDRADSAMYYSKQNGRGRITIDSPEVRASVKLT